MLHPRKYFDCGANIRQNVIFPECEIFYSLSINRLTLYGFLLVDVALVVTWSSEGESAAIKNCIMSLVRAGREPEGHQSISTCICALRSEQSAV